MKYYYDFSHEAVIEVICLLPLDLLEDSFLMQYLRLGLPKLDICLLDLLVYTLSRCIRFLVVRFLALDHAILWLIKLVSLLIIVGEYLKVRSPDHLGVDILLGNLGFDLHRLGHLH